MAASLEELLLPLRTLTNRSNGAPKSKTTKKKHLFVQLSFTKIYISRFDYFITICPLTRRTTPSPQSQSASSGRNFSSKNGEKTTLSNKGSPLCGVAIVENHRDTKPAVPLCDDVRNSGDNPKGNMKTTLTGCRIGKGKFVTDSALNTNTRAPTHT